MVCIENTIYKMMNDACRHQVKKLKIGFEKIGQNYINDSYDKFWSQQVKRFLWIVFENTLLLQDMFITSYVATTSTGGERGREEINSPNF